MTETFPLTSSGTAVDVTCMFGLGFAAPQSGSLDDLASAMILPVREVPGGVEVAFTVESEEAVRRFMEAESRRRADLEFSVHRTADAVVLKVTGRREA